MYSRKKKEEDEGQIGTVKLELAKIVLFRELSSRPYPH